MRYFYDIETGQYKGQTNRSSADFPTPEGCGETTIAPERSSDVFDPDNATWYPPEETEE